MNKIWQMLRQDLKNIFINEATFILIFLMLILPTMFIYFILKANQQPLNNTGKIKVALINKDQGGIINDVEVNLGDELTKLIKNSDGISWKVVSYEEALRGGLIGRYYSKVVIPEDFTTKIATLNTEHKELPRVQYDMNWKENVYAPTFNSVNNAELQANIQRSIIKAVKHIIESVMGSTEVSVNLKTNDVEIGQLVKAILLLDENKDIYLKCLEEYEEVAGKVIVGLSNIDNEIVNSKIDTKEINRIKHEMETVLADTIQIEAEYKELTGEELGIGYGKLRVSLEKIIQSLEYLKNETPEFQINIREARAIAAQFYGAVSKISDSMVDLIKHLYGTEAKLGLLAQNGDINNLIDNLKNNPELVAEYLEAPMLIEKIDEENLLNKDIMVVPFNMAIAMWIGKAMLITVLSVRFNNRVLEGRDKSKKEIEYITLMDEYIAKGLFFIILGAIQDILMISVIRLLFNVGENNQILFLGIGLLGSITFTTIVYTAASVFSQIGKLGVHFISVLQLILLGGIFPLQIIPEMFFKVNKFMPFVYVVGIFRELQVGIITADFYKGVIILLLFIVYTIILGVLSKLYLTPYITKLCHMIQKSNLFMIPNKYN